MKSKKTFTGLIIFAAVLVLGIGYAAIADIPLNISGTASATASDENFKVEFDQVEQPTAEIVTGPEDATVTASVKDATNATITVTGLTTVGDEATATYKINNLSPELDATLLAEASSSNNYFTVDYAFENDTVTHNGSTKITVTVKLAKTPAADQSSDVTVKITAAPVQG